MYKYFISYSQSERGLAIQVCDRLISAGQTVWMDDFGGAAGEFLGIPAGQRHRDTIRSAILNSATFLIVDSAPWRASAYCAYEWEIARRAGRRTAAITDPALPPLDVGCAERFERLDSLLGRLELHEELAIAQVRLDEARLHGGSSQGLLARVLGGPERQADAELLATVAAGDGMPRITPAQAEFVRQVIHEGSIRRRRLRLAGTSLLSVLALLAGVSVVAGVNASVDAGRAVASKTKAESLDLANQSLTGTSARAVDLARRAWALDRNDESASALSSALAAEKRVAVRPAVSITNLRQLAAMPGGLLVASDSQSLTTLDESGQRIVSAKLPSAVSNSPVLIAGDLAVVLSNPDAQGQRSLYRYSPATGAISTSSVRGINSVGQGPNGELWVAIAGDSIAQYLPVEDRVRTLASSEENITALAATYTTVAVLTDASVVRTFHRSASDLVGHENLRLANVRVPLTAGPADPDQSEEQSSLSLASANRDSTLDRLISCGDSLNVIVGMKRAIYPLNRHITLAHDLTPRSGFTTVSGTSFACGSDGMLVAAGRFSSRLTTFWPNRFVPYPLITIKDRFLVTAITSLDGHLAVLVNNGQLRVAGDAPDLRRETGASMFAAPVPGGLVLQDLVGNLWLVKNGAPAVKVGMLGKRLGNVLSSGHTTIAWAEGELVQLAAQGIVRRWGPIEAGAWSLSPDGEHVVIVGRNRILIRSVSTPDEASLPLPALTAGETIKDVASDGITSYLWTSSGRILRLDAAGAVVATWPGRGSMTGHIALGDGSTPGVLLASADHVVSLFDERLNVKASRYVGAIGATLESNPSVGVALLSVQDGRLLVLDTANLRIRQSTAAEVGLESVKLSPDGASILQFSDYKRTKSVGGMAVYQDLAGVWREALSTGVFPAVPSAQEEVGSWLVASAICLSCSPG